MTTYKDWNHTNAEYRELVLKALSENEERINSLVEKLAGKVIRDPEISAIIKHIVIAQNDREVYIRNLADALIPRSALPVPKEKRIEIPPLIVSE